jgi:hypothetical protein
LYGLRQLSINHTVDIMKVSTISTACFQESSLKVPILLGQAPHPLMPSYVDASTNVA